MSSIVSHEGFPVSLERGVKRDGCCLSCMNCILCVLAEQAAEGRAVRLRSLRYYCIALHAFWGLGSFILQDCYALPHARHWILLPCLPGPTSVCSVLPLARKELAIQHKQIWEQDRALFNPHHGSSVLQHDFNLKTMLRYIGDCIHVKHGKCLIDRKLRNISIAESVTLQP